jgi:hypothetical protein
MRDTAWDQLACAFVALLLGVGEDEGLIAVNADFVDISHTFVITALCYLFP